MAKRRMIFPALICSALLACGVLAPQALAVETGEPDTTAEGTTTEQEEAGVQVLTDVNGNPVELSEPMEVTSQYNLASENWDELLNSETEGAIPVYVVTSSSPSTIITHKSSGGFSKVMIAAIIAFALAAVGIIFFIYSQFIHKAKLRRKLEAQRQEELFQDEDSAQERQEPIMWKEDPFPPRAQNPQRTDSLTKEDEKRLQEVDWDALLGGDDQEK